MLENSTSPDLEQSFKQVLRAKHSLEELIAKEGRKGFTFDILKASSAGAVFAGSALMFPHSIIGGLLCGTSALISLYYGKNAASYLKGVNLSDYLKIETDEKNSIVKAEEINYDPTIFNRYSGSYLLVYLSRQLGQYQKIIENLEQDLKETITFNVMLVEAQRGRKKNLLEQNLFIAYSTLAKMKSNFKFLLKNGKSPKSFLKDPIKNRQANVLVDELFSKIFSYGQGLFELQLLNYESGPINKALVECIGLAKKCSYLSSSLALRGEQQITALEELAQYY